MSTPRQNPRLLPDINNTHYFRPAGRMSISVFHIILSLEESAPHMPAHAIHHERTILVLLTPSLQSYYYYAEDISSKPPLLFIVLRQ